MKLQVRKNTFETNSSSMHSVVLCNTPGEVSDKELLNFLKKPTNKEKVEDISLARTREGHLYLIVSGKSFGSEFAFYDDWLHKLLYLVADTSSISKLSLISEAIVERFHEIDNPSAQSVKGLLFLVDRYNERKGETAIIEKIGDYSGGMNTGNVDHQSYGLASGAIKLINKDYKKAIKDFVFSSRFVVFTDSDGGCYLHENIEAGTLSTEKFIAEVVEEYAVEKNEKGKYTRDYSRSIPVWRFLDDLVKRNEDYYDD